MNYSKLILVLAASSLIYFVYLFIPNNIVVNGSSLAIQPGNTVMRGILILENWNQWMPQKKGDDQKTFSLAHGPLKIISTFVATVNTEYQIGDKKILIPFVVESIGKDSSKIEYELTIENKTISPYTRVANYFLARSLKNELGDLINKAGKYYTADKSTYGFDIIKDKVKDSLYISTEHLFPDTPSTIQVYSLIDQVANYIKKNNGTILGDPMVNITQVEKLVYTQVAFPIAKLIPTNATFALKKMVLGNILRVNVIGDQKLAYKAKYETENFIHDKNMYSPAMSYITYNNNRLVEKDSTKWVSTIFFPVY